MLDLRGILDVCIITNGRSSFEYVNKSIREQKNVIFDTHIIRDKKWVDANNICLELCSSKHFLRVDDDMLLHNLSLCFIGSEILKRQDDRTCFFLWRLWQPSTSEIVNGIKAYNVDLTKKIGGFKENQIGKIDKLFFAKVLDKKLGIVGYKECVIGIHMSCDAEETLRYSRMRGEHLSKKFKTKEEKIRRMGKYPKSLNDQYLMLNELVKLNSKSQSRFYNFVQNNV